MSWVSLFLQLWSSRVYTQHALPMSSCCREWRVSFSILEHCGVKWAFVSPPEYLAILCNIFTIGKKSFSVPKKQPLGEFLFKKASMNLFEHRHIIH